MEKWIAVALSRIERPRWVLIWENKSIKRKKKGYLTSWITSHWPDDSAVWSPAAAADSGLYLWHATNCTHTLLKSRKSRGEKEAVRGELAAVFNLLSNFSGCRGKDVVFGLMETSKWKQIAYWGERLGFWLRSSSQSFSLSYETRLKSFKKTHNAQKPKCQTKWYPVVS